MRKTIFSLASLMMLSTTAFAQQQVEDEVTMGASYTNHVFYNLETQDEQAVAHDLWDIAFFRNGLMDYGIKINEAKGWKLFEVGEITAYDNINVDDADDWTQLYNSSTDYTKGAFDQASDDGEITAGWGYYNTNTHHVIGSRAFVLQNEDDYIKIKIDDYFVGYTFTYAEWNGTAWSEDVEKTIANGDADSYYNYYDFDAENVVTVEPGKETWDLLFAKYTDIYYHGEFTTPNQVVTGVVANPNVKIAKTTNDEASTSDLSEDMNVIGAKDWKFLNDSFAWEVDSDINYFIKRNDEDTVYKINFTGFEGSETGIIHFTIDNEATLAVEQVAEGVSFNVYPNPTTDKRVQVVYDITATNAGQNQITIYALNGAVVYKSAAESQTGFYTQTLDLGQLTAGVYILEFKSGNQSSTKKIVLQ